jgi:WD40 repeat protein
VFSPDGTRIVTASYDKTARVWNADGTGKPLLLEGHQDVVYSAAFSPDGERIVTASWDKTARVWNADGTGEPLLLEGHQDRIYSAGFSPDGTRIVTASGDKTVRVWNADGTGKPLLLEGHGAAVVAGAIGGGAFRPDGTQIVSVSDDKTVRLWNADGTGEPAILRFPEIDAFSAAFSPDGTRIVTASHSGRDPATGKIKYWATVWPRFQRITGLDDPALWTATRYCPPIELRKELLGVSEEVAAAELASCQRRVAEANDANDHQAARP